MIHGGKIKSLLYLQCSMHISILISQRIIYVAHLQAKIAYIYSVLPTILPMSGYLSCLFVLIKRIKGSVERYLGLLKNCYS